MQSAPFERAILIKGNMDGALTSVPMSLELLKVVALSLIHI